jgi:glutamate-1-semialdehyde 2,1-aminomutase
VTRASLNVGRGLRSALERYELTHPSSKVALEEMARSLPGGDTRSTTWFDPYPVVMERASGTEMVDIDGNTMIDFFGNYTSLIHGHAPSFIVKAVRTELERGWVFAAPMTAQAELGSLISGRVASVDLVRFTNSGTEAGLLALRLARAATGKARAAVAYCSYHGTSDEVSSDPMTTRSILYPYNDADGAQSVLMGSREEIAAVFVEPILGSGGLIPAELDFLMMLRQVCSEIGALLVVDEVMSFRLAYGGYQSHFALDPDLTMFGKVIGGGLPIGAVGGRAEIMSAADPRHDDAVAHGGTFNGNRLSMAAGAMALHFLTPSEIDRINALGERLRGALRESIDEHSLPLSVTGAGSLVNVHAAPDVSLPEEAQRAADGDLARYIHLSLLNRGMFIAPRGEMCISTPMEESTVGRALDAFADVAAELASL